MSSDSDSERLYDIVADLLEVGIDAILVDGALREIPIVSTLLKLALAARSIPDRLFASKVKRFLSQVEKASVRQRMAFADRLDNNRDECRRAGAAVLFALERADDLKKAEIVGACFSAYLRDELRLDEFRRLLSEVGYVFVDDLMSLKCGSSSGFSSDAIERLRHTSFVETVDRHTVIFGDDPSGEGRTDVGPTWTESYLSHLGRTLQRILDDVEPLVADADTNGKVE